MSTDPDCIFCKIAADRIPSHKIYEDDHVLAFLDINPLSEGHTLIIPKTHAVTLDQLPADSLAACGFAIQKIAPAVMKVAGLSDWNLLQNNGKLAGQVVMHVHFHIIPRREGDGLGFRWPAGKLSDDCATELKKAIVAEM
ncbi:MAG: HIT family protein [Phycisphaerales bacterium]